eukprot:jgi/Mesvir1/16860/Mv15745-RA.1
MAGMTESELHERLAEENLDTAPILQKDVHDVLDKFNKIVKDCPANVLRECAGVVFTITRKMGLVVSKTNTSGFAVARLPASLSTHHHWSAPCPMSGMGMSVGLHAGRSNVYKFYVFGDRQAFEDFVMYKPTTAGTGGPTVSGQEAGQVDPTTQVGLSGTTHTYTYSKSKRAMSGAAVERLTVDRTSIPVYYGADFAPEDILHGRAGVELLDRHAHLKSLTIRLDKAGSIETEEEARKRAVDREIREKTGAGVGTGAKVGAGAGAVAGAGAAGAVGTKGRQREGAASSSSSSSSSSEGEEEAGQEKRGLPTIIIPEGGSREFPGTTTERSRIPELISEPTATSAAPTQHWTVLETGGIQPGTGAVPAPIQGASVIQPVVVDQTTTTSAARAPTERGIPVEELSKLGIPQEAALPTKGAQVAPPETTPYEAPAGSVQ